MHLHFIVQMMNLLCTGFIFMEQEIWKQIPKFRYYEASNLGNIRSLDKLVKHNYGGYALKKGKLLKPSVSKGYLVVGVYMNRRNYQRKVHQLIALTFHKKPKYKSEVLHLNDIKTDNRAVNLKWGTNVENMKSAWANGLVRPPFAWERKKTKYGKETYKKIIELYNTGNYNRHQISIMCNYPMYCIYNFIKTYIKHKILIDKMLFQ